MDDYKYQLTNKLFSLCSEIKIVEQTLNNLSKMPKRSTDEITIMEGKYWLQNKSYYPTPEQHEKIIKKIYSGNIKKKDALLELLDSLICRYWSIANEYLLLLEHNN
tara:strand:+ start:844 stop:1161 length:318 start_codon:yes stop_codon:yes gene_type:complete